MCFNMVFIIFDFSSLFDVIIFGVCVFIVVSKVFFYVLFYIIFLVNYGDDWVYEVKNLILGWWKIKNVGFMLYWY